VLCGIGAAAVIAALAGCGGSEPPAMSGQPSAAASTPRPDDANQALLNAGEAAQRAVTGSTVISIESESNDTRWEVQVVTADGTEHQVQVSTDGSSSAPSVKSEGPDDKAKHRNRVEAAKIDYRRAVSAVTRAVPGRITELDLDTHDGTTVWEADVIDSGNTKHEVRIDAESGEVVTQN
jgi:uncharacterized membrane protein YkoI